MDTVVQDGWRPDRDILLDEMAAAWWAVLGGEEPAPRT
jgi:hypothetical protein